MEDHEVASPAAVAKPPTSDSDSDSASDSSDPEAPPPLPRRSSRRRESSANPIDSKPKRAATAATADKPKPSKVKVAAKKRKRPSPAATPRLPLQTQENRQSPPSTPPVIDRATKEKLPAAAATTAERHKPSNVKLASGERKRPVLAAADADEHSAATAAAAAAAGNSSSSKPFQRLWLQEDEISLLQGILEFKANNCGADPAASMDAFYEFICRRRSLQIEFSKTQIYDKMRRLKKKHQINLCRSKKTTYPAFAKSHDQASFELSKKIWAPRKLAALPASDGRHEDLFIDAAAAEEVAKMRHQKVKASSAAEQEVKKAATKDQASRRPTEEVKKAAINSVEKKDGYNLPSGLLGSVIESKPTMAGAMEERCSKLFFAGAKLMLDQVEIHRDLLQCLVDDLDRS
ncbi:unnamed protein product [Spirodela intermedia]|uniref:Glabrous enhancer-binding protein-like DBD domain-containing protein n=1 Tax=Spirodela intermedia TaxID=51605 RepID=A0ABN7E8V7_SPIIN|nr:unnamed protein product [Spirodela intermedia]